MPPPAAHAEADGLRTGERVAGIGREMIAEGSRAEIGQSGIDGIFCRQMKITMDRVANSPMAVGDM